MDGMIGWERMLAEQRERLRTQQLRTAARWRRDERERWLTLCERLVQSAKLLAAQMTDPGTEALAAIYEAEKEIRARRQ